MHVVVVMVVVMSGRVFAGFGSQGVVYRRMQHKQEKTGHTVVVSGELLLIARDVMTVVITVETTTVAVQIALRRTTRRYTAPPD